MCTFVSGEHDRDRHAVRPACERVFNDLQGCYDLQGGGACTLNHDVDARVAIHWYAIRHVNAASDDGLFEEFATFLK